MKRNWIITIILFLLATNAALITTLIISNKTSAPMVSFEMRSGHSKSLDKRPRFEQHLSEELGLNEQQLKDIKVFSDSFHVKRLELLKKTNDLRWKFHQQLSLNDIDTTLLTETAQQIGILNSEIMLLEFEHYRNIRSVCSTEQAHMMDSLGRSEFKYFKNRKRETSKMQWRQKHSGNPPFNKQQRKHKYYEGTKK